MNRAEKARCDLDRRSAASGNLVRELIRMHAINDLAKVFLQANRLQNA